MTSSSRPSGERRSWRVSCQRAVRPTFWGPRRSRSSSNAWSNARPCGISIAQALCGLSHIARATRAARPDTSSARSMPVFGAPAKCFWARCSRRAVSGSRTSGSGASHAGSANNKKLPSIHLHKTESCARKAPRNRFDCDCCLTFARRTAQSLDSGRVGSFKRFNRYMRRIVILGCGFGGFRAARELERELSARRIQLTVVSDRADFLYTPLLPNVATGELDAAHITFELREDRKST